MTLDAKLHTDGYLQADLQTFAIIEDSHGELKDAQYAKHANAKTPKTHRHCKN